jgi:hypothetical protein
MGVNDTVRNVRQDMTEPGEPLLERERTVQGMGAGGATPYVNATAEGCDIVGIDIGDGVSVQVYEDRIVIERTDAE